VKDIQEFKRQGLTISQISSLTGFSRPTVRKYLIRKDPPQYGPRAPRFTKLAPFQSYIDQRLSAGVWNAVVLYRELCDRGYPGRYTVVKDYLRPKRREAEAVAVRRFETAPGHQAQVDWGELGIINFPDGSKKKVYGFVMTLGFSRAMFADVATDQKLPTFLRMHEAAFENLGGVPEELLYDWTKTAAIGLDDRGEVKWQSTFSDFAGYWGFTPRICRAYRPQTKGKVESGIGYIKKNFLLSQYGQEPTSLQDLKSRLRAWNAEVATTRVHGTTYRVVRDAWQEEKPHLHPISVRPAYPLSEEQVRMVSRDAFVAYRANRYSVPWQTAGKEVIVREKDARLEIVRDGQVLASHNLCPDRCQTIVVDAHHEGIPTAENGRRRGKPRLSLTFAAPQVEVRPLSVYEAICESVIEQSGWEAVA